jgi:hypothetical protein
MAFDSQDNSVGTFTSTGADSQDLDCFGVPVINEINYFFFKFKIVFVINVSCQIGSSTHQ